MRGHPPMYTSHLPPTKLVGTRTHWIFDGARGSKLHTVRMKNLFLTRQQAEVPSLRACKDIAKESLLLVISVALQKAVSRRVHRYRLALRLRQEDRVRGVETCRMGGGRDGYLAGP